MKQTPYNGWPYPNTPADEATIPSHVEGFILPIDSDIAVLKSIVGLGQNDFTNLLNDSKFQKPPFTSGDVGEIVSPGAYPISVTSGVTGLPASLTGALIVAGSNNAVQVFYTWEKVPRIFLRRRLSSEWDTWTSVSWRSPDVPANTDLNTLKLSGYSGVVTTSTLNRPDGAGIGVLEVFALGNGFLQRYTTWEDVPRVWVRRGLADGSWGSWVKVASTSEVEALARRLDEAGSSRAVAAGSKVVPLCMTQPGTTVTSSEHNAGTVRWVRRYAHAPVRVRVHVKNANPANAASGSSLALSSIVVGAADSTGSQRNSKVALSAGTIPGNASELVSGWVDVPGIQDGDYLAVSISYSGGSTVQINQGGGWFTPTDAATSSSVEGWQRSQLTPLYCWVEAEVPAYAPVIVGSGDSITIGTAAADPVGDSFISQYAYECGAMPVILAQHGSTMQNWTAGSQRWKLYGDFPLASLADAVVSTMGQNDLGQSGMTVSELTTRHGVYFSALRAVFPSTPVFLGAITPSNKPSAVEAVRREFNEYRKTLPMSVRGYLDFATAVGGPADEDLLAGYSADGLHPNSAGQKLMAGMMRAHRVTPKPVDGYRESN